MKNLKKLLALVLALAICAAFALPALAADDEPKYTLTMKNPQPNHTYKIYQLLTGTPLQDGGNNIPNGTLGNVGWGASVTPDSNGGAYLGDKNYASAQAYAEHLSTLTAAGQLDAEIESIKKDLNPNYVKAHEEKKENDITSYVWTVEGGYYAVYDETPDIPEDSDNSLSHVMVQVVGPTTITPKPEKLTPDKKVKDSEDNAENAYKDAISSQVGKILTYKVTAKVAVGTMNLSENYYVGLTDTMSKGQTYDASTANIAFFDDDGEPILITGAKPSINHTLNADGTTTLTVGDVEVEIKGEKATAFDLKSLIGKDNMPTTGNVTVELTYQATVNADALTIDAVTNDVTWNYGNNPENQQTSVPDHTDVFVYELEGIKVDGDNNNAPLAGAGFKIYTSEADGKKGEEIKLYTIEGVDKYFALLPGQTLPETVDGKKTSLVNEGQENANVAMVTDQGANLGKFTIEGLPKGWYVLSEAVTPSGYNTIPDLLVEIAEVVGDDGKIAQKCVYHYEKENVTDDEGNVTEKYKDSTLVTIANFRGTLLPSTGGIGTTIFYVVGAVLVVGAGVLLFTKRRAKG